MHRELPVRLAHRAVELEDCAIFKHSPSIVKVCKGYKNSFAQIINCPAPFDQERESNFARLIQQIYERHSSTMITMARGAHEIRLSLTKDNASFADFSDVQKRLDDFYLSRIGIRMVIIYFCIVFDENQRFDSICRVVLCYVVMCVL